MAVIETWYNQDLQQPVKVHYLDGSLFSHNGNGNRIGVHVFDNGSPVTLSGTVSGYVVTSDGSTVPCTGSRSGQDASILIPAAAYQPGAIFITVFLKDGSTVTTLASVATNVLVARTGNQVSPGSVVTDWTQTINAAMQAVVDANAANMAVPYESLTYPVPLGKYTLHDNLLYRCIFPIASSEAWTASHWTRVKLGDDITDLKSAIEHTNGGFDVDVVGSEAAGTSKIRAIVGGFYKGQEVTVTNNGSDGSFIVNWYKPDGTRFAQTQIEHGSSATIVLTDLIDYVNIYNVNGTGINAHFYAEFLGDAIIKDEIGSVMGVVKNVNNNAVNIATGTLTANTRLIMPYNVFSGRMYKVTNNADNTIAFSFRETPSSQSTDVTTFNAGETKIVTASINASYVSVWSNGSGSVSIEQLETNDDRYHIFADAAHIQGSDLTWELGSIVSGVDSSSTTRVRCGYIEVTEGTRVVANGAQNSLAVILYDENKTFISSTDWITANLYTIGSGTKFIRILIRKSANNETISSGEVDSQGARCAVDLKLLKDTILFSYSNAKVKSIENAVSELNQSIFENNSIDLKWVVGGIKTDGSDDTWNARLRSQYIDVKYMSYITADVDSGFKWLYWLYDKNKTAMPSVSSISWKTTGQTYVVPNGAAYMRISFANTSNTSISVNDGSHFALAGDGKIGTIIDDNYSEPMPVYFKTQVGTVIENCKEDMLSTGRNGDSFVFITDIHWDGNFKHSPSIIREIAKKTNIKFTCCTGDLIDRSATNKDAEVSSMQDCVSAFNKTGIPFLTTAGNHDRNSDGISDSALYLAPEELFAITQNPVSNQNIIYADMDRICFYHDRPATATRYIFIDSGYSNISDYDVTNEEIAWVHDVIENAPSGWHFIIVVHSLGAYQSIVNPVSESNQFVYKTGAQALLSELDTMLATYKIEAIFVGHTHYDAKDETTGGIPIVWTNSDTKWQYYGMPQPSDYTVNSQCFDVVTINYAEKKIYLRRVGRGTDRIITYGT